MSTESRSMVAHPMVVSFVSSIFGAFVLWAFATNVGWLRDEISDEQLERIASKLLHNEEHYKRLVHLLRQGEEIAAHDAAAKPQATAPKPAVVARAAPPVPVAAAASPESQTPVVKSVEPRILAMIVVRDGQVQMASSGVRYDATQGLVHFDNPDKQPFVPVVSTIGQVGGDDAYLDTMHYVGKDSLSLQSFRVARMADVDLPDQLPVPRSFSAIVVTGVVP